MNGSYIESQIEKDAVSRKESNISNMSTGSAGKANRKDRVAEHAENVRRVLENLPRRSIDELTLTQ